MIFNLNPNLAPAEPPSVIPSKLSRVSVDVVSGRVSGRVFVGWGVHFQCAGAAPIGQDGGGAGYTDP